MDLIPCTYCPRTLFLGGIERIGEHGLHEHTWKRGCASRDMSAVLMLMLVDIRTFQREDCLQDLDLQCLTSVWLDGEKKKNKNSTNQ